MMSYMLVEVPASEPAQNEPNEGELPPEAEQPSSSSAGFRPNTKSYPDKWKTWGGKTAKQLKILDKNCKPYKRRKLENNDNEEAEAGSSGPGSSNGVAPPRRSERLRKKKLTKEQQIIEDQSAESES